MRSKPPYKVAERPVQHYYDKDEVRRKLALVVRLFQKLALLVFVACDAPAPPGTSPTSEAAGHIRCYPSQYEYIGVNEGFLETQSFGVNEGFLEAQSFAGVTYWTDLEGRRWESTLDCIVQRNKDPRKKDAEE